MPGTIQSVERAADIMRVLAAEPRRHRLTQLARSLGLAKATVHGILRTLQHAGLVEQDPATGEYRLGPGLLHLGSRYLDGHELRAHALGRADALAVRTGESVRIGVSHAGQVLIVHHVCRPSGGRQVSEVGALLPARSTALGKVLLAGDAGKRLEEVRATGWAADLEETAAGQASIAAPIRDGAGHPVGAIGITGPVGRIIADGVPRPDLVGEVRGVARTLERALAAKPRPAAPPVAAKPDATPDGVPNNGRHSQRESATSASPELPRSRPGCGR